MFNTVDLVLLIIGVGITFGLMMILPINNFVVAIIAQAVLAEGMILRHGFLIGFCLNQRIAVRTADV